MKTKSKATAFAEVDAICDAYEQAYRRGKVDSADDRTSLLDTWLDRIAPKFRSWLREELVGLRDELRAAEQKSPQASASAAMPADVDANVWQAVACCRTFRPLSKDSRVALARSIEPREFSTGTVLLESGKRTTGLYLITNGNVDIFGREGTSRHKIATDGIGSVLGEMSLITGHPCSADVIATTPVQSLVLGVEAFESLRAEYPEIEIALSQLVSDRLGHRSRDALCGKSLGGFRLQRCISSGAMGVVYAAESHADCKPYALKMLRHQFIYSPRVVSRFDQEADFLRQLDHPNIVSMRGHFVEYRTRFIVLDLYDGSDLRQVIAQHGPLSESRARGVLGQIAAGLSYAHRTGVLHLDLKPANVLINKEGQVAITDFGLGRLIESDGCDQEVVGTPLYMPPEQFTMTDIGPHCDWYSFACIACELITGQRIFDAHDATRFLEDKLRVPSSSWPVINASEEFRLHLKTALQPLVDHRDLDLDEIASWARPVPELAVDMTAEP